MTKIVIVGGVAGGASAAARARRLSESAEIIMFERGEFVSFANCGLPYQIGGEFKSKRIKTWPNCGAIISLHSRYLIIIKLHL